MKAARLLLLVTLILCGNLLAQTNPIPFVNQPLVPDAAQPGGSGFTLTVNGTGFVSGSVVNWNGSPRPTTFVTGLQVTATISASDIAAPNTAAVTVVNPSPGGGKSNPADFVVALPAPDVAMLASHFFVNQGLMSAGVAGDFNGDGKRTWLWLSTPPTAIQEGRSPSSSAMAMATSGRASPQFRSSSSPAT